MVTISRACCATAFAAAMLASTSAFATPIIGTLNVTGDATVTASLVDILSAGGGNGAITVNTFSQTGSFAALAGTNGSMKDLNTFITPVGAPGSVPLYIAFAANPDINLELTFLNAGVFGTSQLALPAAAGQTGTPVGSMYNLANITGIDSTLSFSMSGVAHRVSTGETTPFIGVFTMQFTQPYQSLLSTWAANGSSTASFSATFTVDPGVGAPEPASLGLLAGGAMLLLKRRRTAR